MNKTKEQPETRTAAMVAVNFPQEGEHIDGREYTLRIEAKTASAVEVSIDQNEWQGCRAAGGYWWYDWAGFAAGKHRVVARILPHNGGGRHISRPVSFQVDLPER
jgi:hypothetical protein